MSETYYAATHYDVYFQYGAWRGAFYLYRPFNREFATAEAAMAFCERWHRDPWPAMP